MFRLTEENMSELKEVLSKFSGDLEGKNLNWNFALAGGCSCGGNCSGSCSDDCTKGCSGFLTVG